LSWDEALRGQRYVVGLWAEQSQGRAEQSHDRVRAEQGEGRVGAEQSEGRVRAEQGRVGLSWDEACRGMRLALG